MSEYIPAEREGLYVEMGLEDLLDDSIPKEGPLVIDEKKDGLGNVIQLVWDRDTDSIHMRGGADSDLDVEVEKDAVRESFDDHIAVFAGKLGWTALEGVLIPYQAA